MPAIGISLAIPFTKTSELSLWTIVNEDCIWYRKGERDDMYVIDYSDDCGETWELDLVQLELDEDNIVIAIDDGVEGYRHQVRDGIYYIDHELTPTGFTGTEDLDWEWIYTTSPQVEEEEPDYEDLSTYAETDASGFLTIETTKVTATSVLREGLCYLVKDFGVDYFGDFEIHFILRVSSLDNDNQAYLGCVLASNTASGGLRDIGDGSGVHVMLEGGATFDLNVGDEAVAFSHLSFDFDTIYYVKFIRSGVNNTIYVYSDEAMTTLVATVPRTDGTTGKYRYLHVASSLHYGGSFTGAKVSGYIDKIQIISH